MFFTLAFIIRMTMMSKCIKNLIPSFSKCVAFSCTAIHLRLLQYPVDTHVHTLQASNSGEALDLRQTRLPECRAVGVLADKLTETTGKWIGEKLEISLYVVGFTKVWMANIHTF